MSNCGADPGKVLVLLHKLENTEIKNKIRLYETKKKRIISANYGILLNQILLNQPNFRTKVHDNLVNNKNL